jgi:hypothetical protein
VTYVDFLASIPFAPIWVARKLGRIILSIIHWTIGMLMTIEYFFWLVSRIIRVIIYG